MENTQNQEHIHHHVEISKGIAHDKHSDFLHKTLFFFSVAIVVFIAFWLVSTYVFPRQSNAFQAVFLTNGQVYYGHLERNVSKDFIKLTNIYYLQFSDTASEDTAQAKDFALIKLGQEIHGPNDAMLINKDHILFIEDLRDNSDIVQSINNYES